MSLSALTAAGSTAGPFGCEAAEAAAALAVPVFAAGLAAAGLAATGAAALAPVSEALAAA